MAQSGVREEGTRPGAGRPGGAAPRPAPSGGDCPGSHRGASARRRGGDRPRRRRHAPRWVATTLTVVALGTAGFGRLCYEHLTDGIEKGERGGGDTKARRTEPDAAGSASPMHRSGTGRACPAVNTITDESLGRDGAGYTLAIWPKPPRSP